MHDSGDDGATRWTVARVQDWFTQQPWLLGCNYVPSTAVNPIEMWAGPTFDPVTIERELGWAARLGFNTLRVFLHDLAWMADGPGLLARFDHFLDIAARHGLRTMPVFFDGCWTNYGYPGAQPDPIPGVHNSRWVQSPQPKIVVDPALWSPLEEYVQAVVEAHQEDERILLWDVYNEPGNEGLVDSAIPLTRAAFRWARQIDPSQPITSPIWNTDPLYDAINDVQLTSSDVITFHSYDDLGTVRQLVRRLQDHQRPIVCTEYMARTLDSQIQSHLPMFHEEGVGALSWGLVRGRTQTIYPWSSLPGAGEPEPWFHDLLRDDGTPYDEEEIAVIRSLARSRSEVRP